MTTYWDPDPTFDDPADYQAEADRRLDLHAEDVPEAVYDDSPEAQPTDADRADVLQRTLNQVADDLSFVVMIAGQARCTGHPMTAVDADHIHRRALLALSRIAPRTVTA